MSLQSLVAIIWLLCCQWQVQAQDSLAMDMKSTCGNTYPVYENKLTFTARSNVAPANPPLECIVYLESAYDVADGRYRLQMVIQELNIEDCNVKLDVFNGKGVTGNYLRQLGCTSRSTDIMYTNGRQATLRFSRPQQLYQTAYSLVLTVQVYSDSNELGTAVAQTTLSVGGIIGIVVGVVAVIAVAILLCWCCHTGYIHNFMDSVGTTNKASTKHASVDSGLEKMSTTSSTQGLKHGIDHKDPAMWTSITNDGTPRQFRRGVPRMASLSRDEGSKDVELRGNETYTKNYENTGKGLGRANQEPSQGLVRESQLYEPYDEDDRKRSPRFLKRLETIISSNRSRESRRSRHSADEGDKAAEVKPASKETVIDHPGKPDSEVFESSESEGLIGTDGKEKEAHVADRFDSEELQSEADVETMTSPLHINAGVRSSIPDLSSQPAAARSPHSKKRSSTSPKSRRHPKEGRHEPDPMGLPPEAFDPVFTTPTSQEYYPGELRPPQPFAVPPMFMPYGMIPMGPGAQAFGYVYQQGVPPGSYPEQSVAANQGAYFVHSVPTADGNMQNTTFAMHSSRTPKQVAPKGKGGHPGAPDYTSTPGGSPRPEYRGDPSAPDLSLVAAGAAPPDPGPGHRSMAMKSATDPDTGIHTTQILWTDTVPDPTDPGPDDSSQITRKTITRVTTRSGHSDLPAQTSTILDYPDSNPAFLSPSSQRYPAVTAGPSSGNIDYYLGQGTDHGQEPMRRPDVVHQAPSRNQAVRDRITFA